ncbi:hypothetical protein I7I51_01707 [Histoplasma capsulatum]|uniref:Uncharacterized protein n=1 Tax=Ajellomyces capsulatus TaxID=5037 RepID=A0A8A1MDH3_AJECA|nr:hypothetical protein I7I51_01707 [Histoplasma capsulatum]
MIPGFLEENARLQPAKPTDQESTGHSPFLACTSFSTHRPGFFVHKDKLLESCRALFQNQVTMPSPQSSAFQPWKAEMPRDLQRSQGLHSAAQKLGSAVPSAATSSAISTCAGQAQKWAVSTGHSLSDSNKSFVGPSDQMLQHTRWEKQLQQHEQI